MTQRWQYCELIVEHSAEGDKKVRVNVLTAEGAIPVDYKLNYQQAIGKLGLEGWEMVGAAPVVLSYDIYSPLSQSPVPEQTIHDVIVHYYFKRMTS